MSRLADIDVHLLHQTEKAWLVTTSTPDEGVWIPKSQAELSETGIPGIQTITLPEWLAQEKGLI